MCICVFFCSNNLDFFIELVFMSLHKGEELEKAVRSSDIPLSRVAEKLGFSRRHMYNLFEKEIIDDSIINETARIINKDLSHLLSTYFKPTSYGVVSEPDVNSEVSLNRETEYWINKYVALLEKYNLLLEKVSRN